MRITNSVFTLLDHALTFSPLDGTGYTELLRSDAAQALALRSLSVHDVVNRIECGDIPAPGTTVRFNEVLQRAYHEGGRAAVRSCMKYELRRLVRLVRRFNLW